MLLFSQKHAFYFSILRIKEGLSHVQQPLFGFTLGCAGKAREAGGALPVCGCYDTLRK